MTRENYAAVLADVQQQIGGAALKAATEEARAKVTAEVTAAVQVQVEQQATRAARAQAEAEAVSYTHLDVYKRQPYGAYPLFYLHLLCCLVFFVAL